MSQRRFGPLMALVVLGVVALGMRLFQVQVVEHEVWAREAANLVRSSAVVPYHRGRFLDRHGRVLVRDEELYTLELVYRDFRRGHPLGQVAHARSALELRAVPLDEALARLEPWALELASLAPAELERFAGGEALPRLGLAAAPEVAGSAGSLRRRWRASDVRFYVGRLLALDRGEWARLRKLEDPRERERPLVELVARWRGTSVERVLGDLRRELQAARAHLAELARLSEGDAGGPDAFGAGSQASDPGAAGSGAPGSSVFGAHAFGARALGEPPPRYPTGDWALDRLVRRLETARRDVEDEVASDLFAWAAGFSAGRVDTDVLARLELGWIAAVLRWDGARLAEWTAERRPAWLAWRDAVAVPSALVRLEARAGAAARPEQLADGLLDELAALLAADGTRAAARRGWRASGELAVLSELPGLLAERPLAPPERVLPFQDPRLARLLVDPDHPWRTVAYAFAPAGTAERSADTSGGERELGRAAAGEGEAPLAPFGHVDEAELRVLAGERWDSPSVVEASFARAFATRADLRGDAARLRALRLVDSWERALQRAVRATLAAAEPADDGTVGAREAGARAGDGALDPEGRRSVRWLGAGAEDSVAAGSAIGSDGRLLDGGRAPEAVAAQPGRLALAPERVDRALERARYVLRDRGSRDLPLADAPPYELVHLVTRWPDRYAGLYVRDRTHRVALELDERGVPIAEPLIGHVRESNLREVIGQRPQEARLRELVRRRVRTPDDEREIAALTARLYRADEMHGGSGLERYLDPELRGRNGFRETEGLQERAEGGERALFREPENGLDVTLTLDLDLQRAALDVLEHPEAEPSDPRRDPVWLANPVGAIVLATPEGEVLVAASVPTEDGLPAPPSRDGERAVARDRTLRRPTFHPPGSVFKPFVAAWMLAERGLDPKVEHECEMQHETQYAGYKSMSCNVKYGHKHVDLSEALERSCNVYFAHLGEVASVEDLQAVCDLFGFGAPTGVKWLEGRAGIFEEAESDALWRFRGRDPARTESVRMQAANGLSVIEATPMQVARATCALATGALPDMRLVRAVGDRPVEPKAAPLSIPADALALVREAMTAVVAEPHGTAHGKGLSAAELGFTLAAKTGSADYFTLAPEFRHEAATTTDKRKHTWVAGWFPAEDPSAVLVVYLHDTVETSSHSAVYVARQFLRRPEVRAFLAAARPEHAPARATGDPPR